MLGFRDFRKGFVCFSELLYNKGVFVYGDIGSYIVLDMFVGFMKLIYNPKALRTYIIGLLGPQRPYHIRPLGYFEP